VGEKIERKRKNILEEARDLYENKEWQKVIDLLESNIDILSEKWRKEAFRLLGWSYYYKAIKGPAEEKKEQLEKAVKNWYRCTGKKVRLSAMNGLPLALYILGDKKKAYFINSNARQDYPDEPSVDNTLLILLRWDGKFNESVEVAERVYEKAMRKGDFRTAGHGKHNQGDALMKLGRTEEALESYREAEKMYSQAESGGFHLEAVKKKIKEIED